MADHYLKGEGLGKSLISKVKVMTYHYFKGEGHGRPLSQR